MITADDGRDVPEHSGVGASTIPGMAESGAVDAAAVELTWGWATDTGRKRRRNEDAVLADRTVFLVADGMGGHARGDVAARTVLDEMGVFVGNSDVTADACAEAVRRAAVTIDELDDDGGRPAGTTLTGALVVCSGDAPYWLVINVGDSRTYLWRGGRLKQVTVDHSAVRELIDAGEITEDQARTHPDRNVITRAVGGGISPRADVWMVPRYPGDVLVACSDGVTGEIDDDEISRLLDAATEPAAIARDLVAAAVHSGGRDNASAVVVAVAGESSPDSDTTRDQPRAETHPSASSPSLSSRSASSDCASYDNATSHTAQEDRR